MSSCIWFPRYLDLDYGRKVMFGSPPLSGNTQTLSTGVFRILHGRLPLRRLEFGKVHHLRIDIQLMTPRKSSTFLSLVLKQQSMKVVKPSSVSPLLVKRKAYALFSSPMLQLKCKYGVRCRLPSLSRNGQLIGFCHVLPKTKSTDSIRRSKQTIFIWELWEHLCDPSRGKRYGKV